MCIAILCKAGTKLSYAEAEESYRCNRNGAGFAYVDENGKVVAKKGYFDFAKWWEAYDEAFKAYGAESPFLIHFRIATAGKINEDNCHPFILAEGKAGLIHNGILWSGGYNDEMSDTAIFAKNTTELLIQQDKMTEPMVAALSKIVGQSNKIVLLYADKTFKIINEDGYSAHWNTEKTIWYSNRTYQVYDSSYNVGRAGRGRWQGSNHTVGSSNLPNMGVGSPTPSMLMN